MRLFDFISSMDLNLRKKSYLRNQRMNKTYTHSIQIVRFEDSAR